MHRFRRPLSLALAAALPVGAPVVLAQEASSTPEAVELDRITVTAGKREQSQREVAGSVSAVSGAALEAGLARSQEDIFKLTPGVQFNKNDPDRALPTIRAVGTVLNASGLGQQQGTTGLYIGDVPVTDPFGYVVLPDIAPLDLDRVEVLRGPQGALFGSGALGGAVRYVFADASRDHASFSGMLGLESVANGGVGHNLSGAANWVLSEGTAGLRVMAYDRADSGFIDNLGTGRDAANDLEQRGGRVAVNLQPTEQLSVRATVFSQKTRIDDGFAVGPDHRRLEVSTPTTSTRESRFDLGQVQLDYDAGPATLSWNSAWTRKRMNATTDVTAMVGPVGALIDPSLPYLDEVVSLGHMASDAQFHELRVVGDLARVDYVVGASYQTNDLDSGSLWRAEGGSASWGPLGMLLPDDLVVTEVGIVRNTEKAVFGTVSVDLGAAWSAEVGGRYYRNQTGFDIAAMQFAQHLNISQHMSESGFTPRASLSYRFGQHMAYALASRGYRFGGVNAASGNPYDSDSLWNYEAGLRLSPGPRTQLDLTAFVVDWSDAQVNARVVTPGQLTVFGIANVGQVSIRGIESTLRTRLSSAWSFDLSASLTDAETRTEYVSNSGTLIESGTRMPSSPKFQSVAQLGYRFAGPADSQGGFYLTHQYTGSRRLALELPGQASAYQTVDARVSFARDGWELGFHVSNLFDQRGIAGGGANTDLAGGLFDRYYLIRPRTVGVTLRYDR